MLSDPPLRFLFLSFGQRYHFFKDKAYLTPTIANARKAIGAGASVVDSLFRATDYFGHPLSSDTCLFPDQAHMPSSSIPFEGSALSDFPQKLLVSSLAFAFLFGE